MGDFVINITYRNSSKHWKALQDTLPLNEFICIAYTKHELCYTIPWISEFLKMMAWIPAVLYSYTDLIPYSTTLQLLKTILHSPLLDLQNENLSKNR